MPTLKKVKLAGILMVVFGCLTATVLHGLFDDPTHPSVEMHWSAVVAGGIAALGLCVFLVGRFGDG